MSNIRENKTEYVTRLAVLLFGVAFALRFYQIAGLGLWRDEIATQILVSSSLKQILHDCFTIEPNPSLYYILLHFWVRIFGDSETSLRLPSAFFGSIAVSMLFLVGRRFFSMRVGLVAALLAAFMPFQVRYGQEARAYALFGMLALASLHYMPLQLKWPTRRSPAIFAVVSCLLLYSHPYAVLLFAAQMAFVAVEWMTANTSSRDPRFLKQWLVSSAVPILAALPWYGNLLLHYRGFQSQFGWINGFPVLSPFKVVEVYFGMARLPLLEEEMPTNAPIAGYILTGAFLIVVLLRKFTHPKSSSQFRSASLFLGAWLFASILLPLGLGHVSEKLFILRYSFPASLGVYLLLAANFDWLLERSKWIFFSACGIVSLYGLLTVGDYYTHFHKEDWRGMVQAIQDRDPDDVPVVLMPTWFMTLFNRGEDSSVVNYYADRILSGGRKRLHYANSLKEAEPVIRAAGRAWVVQMVWYHSPSEAEDRALLSTITPTEHKKIFNIVMDRLEVPRRETP